MAGVPGATVADRFPASEAMSKDQHNHTRNDGDDADSSSEGQSGHGAKKQRAIQKPQHQRPPGIPKGRNNRVKPGSLLRPRARPVPKRHECSGSPPALTDVNSQVEHHVAVGGSGGDAARDCVMHGAKQPEQEVYSIPSQLSYSSLDAQVESSADVEMKDRLHVGDSKMDDELGGKFAAGNADVNMDHNADVSMEHNSDKRVEDDLGTSGLGSTDSESSGIRIEISLVYESQKSVLTVQCALRKVITMFMRKHAIQGVVMAQDNYVRVLGCFPSSQLRGGKDFRFRFSKSVRAIENVKSTITFDDVTVQEVYGEVERDPAQITAPSRCWLRRRCHQNLEDQSDNRADVSNNSEDQLNTPAPNLCHTLAANTPHVKSPKIVDRSFVYRFGEDLAYLTELYVRSESASEFGHACMEALKMMYSVHDHLLHAVPPDGRDRSACRPCPESRTLDFNTGGGGTPLPTPSSFRQRKPQTTCSAPRSNNSSKCAAEWAALKSPATVLCSPQTTAESPAERPRPTHIWCGLMDVDPDFMALAADFEARLNERKRKLRIRSSQGRMVNLRLPTRLSYGPSSSSGKASHSTVRRRRHRLGGIRTLYHRMLAEVHRERAQDFASDDKQPSGTSPGSEGSLDESADSDAAKAAGAEASSTAADARAEAEAADAAAAVGAEASSTAADAEAEAAEAAAAKARAAAEEIVLDGMHSGTLKCARKLRAKHDKSSDSSEDIRASLKAVAAGLVDDCTPAMRKMLAEDPRIEKRVIRSKRRFERQVIQKYKEELRAKRKNETVLLSAAADLALGSCSSAAYATVRKILSNMGLGFALPQVKDLSAARKDIEEKQKEDLKMEATADGWMISPRAAVEMEILRMMQVTSMGSRKESGARSVGVEPERNLWQDHYHIKITLDARRITKKTSQTEVMLVFIPKDQEGVDRCQKAVYYRTIGVWQGKDSRDSVERNLVPFLKEIASLEKDGVLYSEKADSLLGVWEHFKDLDESAYKDHGLHKIRTTVWCCADMAALCALLGHGCAGDYFCSHCMTHRNERHIPYSLLEVPRDISFQALAQQHDMFPKTLYAINAMVDHAGVQGLTARGLQVCTAAAAPDLACTPDTSPQSGPALSNITIQGGCRGLRAGGGGKRKRSAGKEQCGDAREPDAPALKRLVGWRSDHEIECLCDLCKVPAGTVVRVIPVTSFARQSAFLTEHWPSHSLARLPFCALHCLMRVTEALFQNICQMAVKHQDPVIDRMNAGLKEAGIPRAYKKIIGSVNYEKVTFEGHHALRLIRKDGNGVMEIEKILRLMWPSGDAEGDEHYDGVRYVQRTVVLWEQWSKVVQLMSQRDPSKLRLNVVDSEDGFQRFGKECREFMFRYQSMFCQEHCRSFYLHTLLHHAGEFMRELEQSGMCLGMVSNSGAERRHEYGRRAARKALAGGCWRNKNPSLIGKANLFAYLTLKEILIWQYGTDLISHELAMIANRCQDPSKLGGATAGLNSSSVEFTVPSRRKLTEALLAERNEADRTPEDVMMTREEMEAEFDLDPDLEESSRLSRFESGKRLWQKIEPDDDAKYALIGIPYEGERTEDAKHPPGVKADGSKLVYEIEDDRELFNNRDWDVLSEISDDNSADGDEDDIAERWRLTVNSFDFHDDDDCDGDYKPGPADDSDSEVELWDAGPRKSKRLRSCEGLKPVQASANQKIDTPAGVPCCVRGTSVNQSPEPLIMMKQTLAKPLDALSSNQAIPRMPASQQNRRISPQQTLTAAHEIPCMPAPKNHRISSTPARSKKGRP